MSTELAIRNTDLKAKVWRQEREFAERPDAETCQQVAEMIVGSYPNANPADPATYTRALRTLLAGYPASVVARIADPRSGIVTKHRFPPSMAEIQDFAAPLLERMQANLERDREAVRQIERREPEPTPEERAEIEAGLKKLAGRLASKLMSEQSEVQHNTASRARRTQCQEGEAIRRHMGLERRENG